MIKQLGVFIIYAVFLVLNLGFTSLPKYTITVNIKGFKNKKGQIGLALYNNENQYTNNPWKHFSKLKSSAKDSVVTLTLTNIVKGKYAVTFLDDENSNKKMDYSFFGLPQEGFGFSNNANPGFLSAPKYEKCTFDLNADKEMTLNIQYWSE